MLQIPSSFERLVAVKNRIPNIIKIIEKHVDYIYKDALNLNSFS